MKKIIALLLVLCMSGALLAGCGESANESENGSNKNSTQETVTESNTASSESPKNTASNVTVLASGEWGDNITWVWDDSYTLTLSGEGDMRSATGISAYPWGKNEFGKAIETLVIEDGITSIAENAFRLCTSLIDVSLPDSLICIEDYAFYQCESLNSFVFPDSVTEIGEGIFMRCTKLKTLVFGDGLTNLENLESFGYSSEYSYHLDSITFGKNIEKFGYSFSGYSFYVNTITFTGDPPKELSFHDEDKTTLRYPKDNSAWIESGILTQWGGKVEAY